MVLVNSGFHTQKNFSENYPQFTHAPWKMFTTPVLRPKRFKECRVDY